MFERGRTLKTEKLESLLSARRQTQKTTYYMIPFM